MNTDQNMDISTIESSNVLTYMILQESIKDTIASSTILIFLNYSAEFDDDKRYLSSSKRIQTNSIQVIEADIN